MAKTRPTTPTSGRSSPRSRTRAAAPTPGRLQVDGAGDRGAAADVGHEHRRLRPRPLRYADGRTEEWPAVGFAPRKANLVLYLVDGLRGHAEALARLGPHKTGRGVPVPDAAGARRRGRAARAGPRLVRGADRRRLMPGFGHTLATARGPALFALGQAGYALRAADGSCSSTRGSRRCWSAGGDHAAGAAGAAARARSRRVDLVCITHPHDDHLDAETLAAIAAQRARARGSSLPATDVGTLAAAGVPEERITGIVPGEPGGGRRRARHRRARRAPARIPACSAATASGSTRRAGTARSATSSSGRAPDLPRRRHGLVAGAGARDPRARARPGDPAHQRPRPAPRGAGRLGQPATPRRPRGSPPPRASRRRALPLRRRRRATSASRRRSSARSPSARRAPRRTCCTPATCSTCRRGDGGRRRAHGGRPAVAAATTLHHVRDGAGPPLVLLAGIGMDGSAWAPVLDRLTPGARGVARRPARVRRVGGDRRRAVRHRRAGRRGGALPRRRRARAPARRRQLARRRGRARARPARQSSPRPPRSPPSASGTLAEGRVRAAARCCATYALAARFAAARPRCCAARGCGGCSTARCTPARTGSRPAPRTARCA